MKLKIPLSILLALLGVAAAVLYLVQSNQPDKLYHVVQQPPIKPHQNDIAGVGLIESAGGNNALLPYWPGKVTRVYVQPGDHVKTGDPLYALDDTEIKGQYEQGISAVAAHKAAYEELNLKTGTPVHVLDRARAEWDESKAALTESRQQLAHAIIRAPFAGEVLQVKTHRGEFVSLDPRSIPVLLGRTGPLQVRVEVDESQASDVKVNQPAVAYLKGNPSKHFPLHFVRIEPMMVPKTNLTGSSMERVDVRVLQLIYAFDPPTFPVYVGQQLDVYMTR